MRRNDQRFLFLGCHVVSLSNRIRVCRSAPPSRSSVDQRGELAGSQTAWAFYQRLTGVRATATPPRLTLLSGNVVELPPERATQLQQLAEAAAERGPVKDDGGRFP